MNTTRIPALVPSLAFLIAAAAGRASDVRFQTVALSGDPAPGLAGLTFDWFSDPRVTTTTLGSPDPRIAFWADVAGPGVTEANNGTIWSNRTGVLALVAREGDPSPIPNLVWGAIPSPGAALAGPSSQTLGFTASLFDPAQPSLPTNLGMFAETSPGGGFTLVAREGDPVPGAPAGTNFSSLPVAAFDGSFVFQSNNGRFLWNGTPGPVGSLLSSSGNSAPGVSGSFMGHLHNPLGRPPGGALALSATFFPNPTQTGQPTGAGIWLSPVPPVVLTLVATTGGTAFGSGSPIKYKDISAQPIGVSAPSGNAAAYWASLMEGGVTPNNDTAIVVWPGGSGPRVREGDAAPGVGPGIFFSGFSRQFSVRNASQSQYFLAFRATITGEAVSNLNNSGIWLVRQTGAPALIAREGEQVPRLPAGTLYASFSDPLVNEGGQVVFHARLRGPAVTQETSQVLMATERAATTAGPAGGVAPLVRTGDMFVVGPGDARKVNEIILDSGPAGSGAVAFARHGMLAFKLGFKDPIVPPPPPPQLAFTFTQGVFTGTIRCLADINADGALTVADFAAFQNAYVLADLRVCDFTEEGVLSVADFGAFQTAFVSGCP